MAYVIPKAISQDDFHTLTHRARPDVQGLPVNYLSSIGISKTATNVFQFQDHSVMTNSVTVVNETHDILIVINRNNCIQLIEPTNQHYNKYSLNGTIRVECVYSKPVSFHDNSAYIKQYHDYLSKNVRDRMRDEFYKSKPEDTLPADKYNICHSFSFPDVSELFEKYDGAFYHPESDLVFVSPKAKHVYLHPSTSQRELMEYYSDNPAAVPTPTSLTAHLFLNDPDNVYGRAFINLAGYVMEVPITRDRREKPGVFVGTQKQVGMDKYNCEFNRFDFDSSSNPFRIFHSFKDAEAMGQPDIAMEMELQKLKAEAAKVKHQSDMERIDAQVTAASNQAAINAEEASVELQRIKLEAEAAKLKAELDAATAKAKHEAELEKLREEARRREAQQKHEEEMRKEARQHEEEMRRAAEKARQHEEELKRQYEKEMAEARAKAQKEIDESRARQAEAERQAREEKIRAEAEANKRNQQRQEKLNKTDYIRKFLLETVKVIGAVITTAASIFAWYKLRA